MKFSKPQAKSHLEKIFLDQIEKDTPVNIKKNILIDLNNPDKFSFTLKREHLMEIDRDFNRLGIWNWFKSYELEARASTAGIRGLQNPLYPWDARYSMNFLTIALATLGKVEVAKKTHGKIKKVCACETRYNSKQFVELISRIQAANGVKTFVTENYETMPIFLISFLIFMYDLYGGEYVTSSHALSKKIATKDLNTQGSQFIPAETLKFVEEVRIILNEIERTGGYEIQFSSKESDLIDRKFLPTIENGIDLYADYLKTSVATKTNLNYINNLSQNILIDCVGGSMFRTFLPILKRLEIDSKFRFLHKSEDPFHHEVGKLIDKQGEFFDWGCDTTIMNADLESMKIGLPVVSTMKYPKLLKKYPIGTVVLITDPDADRLVTSYIDTSDNIEDIKKYGLVYQTLSEGKILVMFTPNQSFLMTFDFQKKLLEKSGYWKRYNWFMLKTTASQLSWDQWAKANGIEVVNTPVGFKELQDVMMSVERQLLKPKNDVIVYDVFGNKINLGKNPRLLFAGEESGGEIFGPHELIKSKKGRIALSMREKSAGEAILITSAMVSWLYSQKMSLFEYLQDIFNQNNIHAKFEIRIDNKYYNESEPDIKKLNKAKDIGIGIRSKNDMFFLSLALAYKDKILKLNQVKEILEEAFGKLNFEDLEDIKFVGDGTYLLFSKKCVEVRPSGTDAVNKAYSYGNDQWECIKYAKAFSSYEGKRTVLHNKYIDERFYENVKKYAFKLYSDYKNYLRKR